MTNKGLALPLLPLVKSGLNRFWRDPLAPTEEHELESARALTQHHKIIQRKRLLKKLYGHWFRYYGDALVRSGNLASLPVMELGSGSGVVAEFYPEVIRTDVIAHPLVDRVVKAEDLPFETSSIRAILMTDVLHHLPSPLRFFKEASRCLAIGGRILMIEPTNSWWGRFVWGNFHPREEFDPQADQWEHTTKGRLSEANMAIPWIIFVRDRLRFETEFPELRIRSICLHTALSYCLSGGLTYRSFVPSFLGKALFTLDDRLVRILPALATMMTVEVERVSNRQQASYPISKKA